MKEKDRAEIALMIENALLKSHIAGNAKPKDEPVRMPAGKKKPPAETLARFRSFIHERECKSRCFLCDDCEKEIEELIKQAIEKGR